MLLCLLSSWVQRVSRRCAAQCNADLPLADDPIADPGAPADWLDAVLGACLAVAERDHGGTLTPFLDKINWTAAGLSRPSVLVWWSSYLAKRRAALKSDYRVGPR